MSKARRLGLWMNAWRVGTLTQDEVGGLSFGYAPEWLETPGARPLSLSMPLRHHPYRGNLVFNYFDNLLPDSRAIRDRIQARFRASTSHPFDLLAVIGMDCVGAVQIAPENEDLKDVRGVAGVSLSDKQIGDLLRDYRGAPLGMAEEAGDAFRISLAGAQEKTALLWRDGRWHRPLGTTPTTHILKLPIGVIEHSGMDLGESCENEWLCQKIAQAFGLPACQVDMQDFDGIKALVVERFDRRPADGWIMRLPQEDMCQALGYSPNLKYESDGGPGIAEIMGLLRRSRRAGDDRAYFFKSLILFWLLAAIDGHAKNFSVFIEAEGRFRLTPLYDILSAYPLIANGQLSARKIKMAMALLGKNRHYHWHSLQPRHFASTAEQVGLQAESARRLFMEMIDQVDAVIVSVERLLPADFPDAIATPVLEGLRKQVELAFRVF